jgi:hypothetical protein
MSNHLKISWGIIGGTKMEHKNLIALEELAQKLRKNYEGRAKPEAIYDVLNGIVEGFTAKRAHSCDIAGLRTEGIKEICNQLNRLQQERTFETPYEVKYNTCKVKPAIEVE